MPKVLIVDDEPSVLSALRRLLRRSGFDVHVAGSGREALANLEQLVPDLIVSDFRMPGMNGAELLAEAKRRVPGAVRVIITGYSDLDPDAVNAEDRVEHLGRFLTKPWDDDTLGPLLLSLVGNRNPSPAESAA